MNDTQTQPMDHNSDLELQVVALQKQVFLLLLALVVVTATIVFYLFCESRFMSNDLAEIQPQATQIIKAYKLNEQAIQNFHAQLGNYAMTHPSFQPVLKKYGWVATPAK